MWHLCYAIGRGGRVLVLAALARDFGAAAVVLGVFAVAAALPSVTVPATALVLLPALLLAAVVFGRDSALLAALLAALAARLFPSDAADSAGLLTIAALSGAAIAVAALLEELSRRRAEAETAHLRSDRTARRAAERVDDARRQLREAEARLVEAERRERQTVHDLRETVAAALATRLGAPDPALEGAFRSEGGV